MCAMLCLGRPFVCILTPVWPQACVWETLSSEPGRPLRLKGSGWVPHAVCPKRVLGKVPGVVCPIRLF